MSQPATAPTRQSTAPNRPGVGQLAASADDLDTDMLSDDSEWIFRRLPRRRGDVVLALGAGFEARALAAEVHQVIAVDPTELALEAGRTEADAAGITNIVFMGADATALPFLADTFRTVLCCGLLRRLPDPGRTLAEIRRVLRPGGWLGIADIVVSEDPLAAGRTNEILALADPSHIRALSASELQDTLVRAGFEVAGAETRQIRHSPATELEADDAPSLTLTSLLVLNVDA